jgi:hypothetical protein
MRKTHCIFLINFEDQIYNDKFGLLKNIIMKNYHKWSINYFLGEYTPYWQKCEKCGLYRLEIGKRQYSFSWDRSQLEISRPICKKD